MATSLRDFIVGRLAELSSEEEELRHKLENIARERETLLKAERLSEPSKRFGARNSHISRRDSKEIKPNTIKEHVYNILARHPEGLIALDILAKLNDGREVPYERTSLSPQLSRLKQSGVIKLDGSTWSLSQRAKWGGLP